MRTFGLITIIGLSLLAVACSQRVPSPDGSKTIGLAISTQNNPFFVQLKQGAQAAAENAGLSLVVVDAQDDPAKQISSVEDLIQKKVAVILLNPTDSSALSGAVKEANHAHIPVITLDRSVDGGKVAAHIASDNIAGGKAAAEFLVQALNNKGNIIELQGVPGTSAARDRGQGFNDEIKHSGLKIIAQQPANFDRAQALSVTENLLQAHPDVQAIFAQNDEMALGAVRALAEAKRSHVLVVGFDGTADGLQAIKDGKMTATIAQQPQLIGQRGVQLAQRIIEQAQHQSSGKSTEIKFTEPLSVPLKLITKDSLP